MKFAVAFCFCMFVALALARPNEDKYTNRYDNVDLDEILGNDRLFIPYMNCMLDQGKCAPDAKELKEHIPEALENNCEKCSDKHKEGTRKVIKHLINHKADYWKQLTDKYDPEGKYSAKYEKELREVKEA